jgi:hypothetical protein
VLAYAEKEDKLIEIKESIDSEICEMVINEENDDHFRLKIKVKSFEFEIHLPWVCYPNIILPPAPGE